MRKQKLKRYRLPIVLGNRGQMHGSLTAFDISADLTELGKTPVTVVCAGAKSILDIQLTLEYLVSPTNKIFRIVYMLCVS